MINCFAKWLNEKIVLSLIFCQANLWKTVNRA